MAENRNNIQFDVLIKPAANTHMPHSGNVANLKPKQEDIERCLAWFRRQGLNIYPNDFGFSGETTKDHFESTFRIQLIPTPDNTEENPPFTIHGKLQLPENIAPLIDQLTITRMPDLF